MGEEPGDGNGGTLIYSVSSEDAKNPDFSIEPFENGFIVPSNRTARLQASEDGSTIFNISYAGDTGGNYTKYNVLGGQNFEQTGSEISIAPYVGSAPRWIKLFDGDQTGAAVYVNTGNEFSDNDTPDDTSDDFINGNQDLITVNYIRDDVYVSRACGFKTVFNQLLFGVTVDTDNWVINSSVVEADVVNENQAHVQVFH